MKWPWRKKPMEDGDLWPLSKLSAPDFPPLPGDVSPPPAPIMGTYLGGSNDYAVQQQTEQMFAQAIHRLRACGGTYVLITPADETNTGFLMMMQAEGEGPQRFRAYIGLAQTCQLAVARIQMALARDAAELRREAEEDGDEAA